MLDIFFNNAMTKTIVSFVNFCNEQRYYNRHELKFLKKMSIKNMANKKDYKKDFIFTVPKC